MLPDGGVVETRKAPSFEEASFIGFSHSLIGVRSTTVFKTVAFVRSAIPPYGGQPDHYRRENALWSEIGSVLFCQLPPDVNQFT